VAIEDLIVSAFQNQRAGRLREAKEQYIQALQQEPNHLQAITLLATVHHALGDPGAAVEALARAVALAPDSAPLRLNYGFALKALGRLDEAVAAYQQALRLNPAYAQAHFNLAVALEQSQQLDEAAAHYRAAIDANPAALEPHVNLYILLAGQARYEECLAAAQRAVAARPDSLVLGVNLAISLSALDRFDEAEAAFERARPLLGAGSPADRAQFYQRLAGHRQFQHRFAEGLAALDAAVAEDPHNAAAHWARAELLLMIGRFQEGWAEYEWRWKYEPHRRGAGQGHPRPWWDGSAPLKGRTILLFQEQGLGDAIQFLRYAPVLAAERRTRVMLEVGAELVELAAQVPGVAQAWAIDSAAAPPPFDVQLPLMSLAWVMGATVEDVGGAAVPYLRVTPQDVSRWAARLGGGEGMKVGLVWAGGGRHLRDRWRSIPLVQLLPMLRGAVGVRWFSLQKGPAASQALELAAEVPNLVSLGDELRTLLDTAAVMSSLDLIITVDTAAAHLAGALGRAVWTLVPFNPDFRWVAPPRADTPWYPTMRLWRQTGREDWGEIVRLAAAELERHASRRQNLPHTPLFGS
jgi:tetratricopeptide (TPR) repeat protein